MEKKGVFVIEDSLFNYFFSQLAGTQHRLIRLGEIRTGFACGSYVLRAGMLEDLFGALIGLRRHRLAVLFRRLPTGSASIVRNRNARGPGVSVCALHTVAQAAVHRPPQIAHILRHHNIAVI